MKITAVSDLHGNFPKLPGGDLLIIAGDCTSTNSAGAWKDFFDWQIKQNYRKTILVAGNHDGYLERAATTEEARSLGIETELDFEYLCDNGCEFMGFKIWGSPWSLTFPCINPHCTAFTGTEQEIRTYFDRIPRDTDILITHSPPFGTLDGIPIEDGSLFHVGSKELSKRLNWDGALKLHVFGHIHEGYGVSRKKNGIFSTYSINASHVNGDYEPVNAPITLEIL